MTVVTAPGPSPWPQNPSLQGQQGQPPPQAESPRQSRPQGCPPACKANAHRLSPGLPAGRSQGLGVYPVCCQACPGGNEGCKWGELAVQQRGSTASLRTMQSCRCPARGTMLWSRWCPATGAVCSSGHASKMATLNHTPFPASSSDFSFRFSGTRRKLRTLHRAGRGFAT